MVACSGGRDSLLLAFLLAQFVWVQGCPPRLRVLHINHQLHPDADQWAAQVLAWCAAQGLPCTVQAVTVATGNLEQAARQARYAALNQHTAADEVLVLAHHQQDQAETMLMRLCAGSGVTGLAAMREHDVYGQTRRWRPFLAVSREQISALAQRYCPQFIDDPANDQPQYERVWLRQQLWPLLVQHWPQAAQNMGRTSQLMQDAQAILADVLADDWARCGDQGQLQRAAVLALTVPRQRLLLSRWMQGESTYAPPFAHVERLRTWLDPHALRADARLRLDWSGWQFCRDAQRLYRLPQQLPQALDQQMYLAAAQQWQLPSGDFVLRQVAVAAGALQVGQLTQLRPRQGGERIHVGGRVGRWPLKKLLQSLDIAPWWRASVHLWYHEQTLLGVFSPKGFLASTDAASCLNGWHVEHVRKHT